MTGEPALILPEALVGTTADCSTSISGSIHSDWNPSEISSLSGDSGQRHVDLYAYFRNHSLHGREAEQELLHSAYERIRANGAPSEVIFVHGEGGIGKTCLVESMRDKVTDQEGFFCSGKFHDPSSSSAAAAVVVPPFSAISEALSDLCDLVIQEREYVAEDCELEGIEYDVKAHQTQLLNEVGEHAVSVLTRLVSNLAPVVGHQQQELQQQEHLQQQEQSSSVNIVDSSQALANFGAACVQFLRAIASDDQQVFVFLDDLQHADLQSIQAIETLMKDADSKNVLIVCTFRDGCGEPSTTTSNTQHQEKIRSLLSNQNATLQISDIGLRSLELEPMNRLLSEMLEKDETTTRRLSEVVLAKTHGNPYFVKNYLNLLRSESYLRFVKGMWTWDISAISAGTNISDNVVEIVESKVQMLHPHVQFMLKIASCLGFQFPRDVLDQFALENLVDGDQEYVDPVRDHLTRCIKQAMAEGLVEPTRSGNKFKFSHNRVRQICNELLPADEEERQALHLRIGNVVWGLSNDGQRDWYVLAAAEQLNKGAALVKKDREMLLYMQNVNVKAAKIARSKCAFGPSAEFLEAAIACMDSEKEWKEQYQVMLTIHCMAAEMYKAAGRFEDCKKHANVVFMNAQTSFDKMPAYFVMTESLGTQCEVEETIKMGTLGLSKLGIKIPRKPRPLKVMYEMVKTKGLLKHKQDEDLLALPALESKERLAAMTLLGSLLAFGFIADEHELLAMIAMKMIRISIKHGVSRMTPASIACWGILMAPSNPREGHRLGKLALQMATQMNVPSSMPLTIAFAHGFLIHKKASLQESLAELEEGYNTGVQVGQVYPAGLCRVFHTTISVLTGVRLVEAERETRTQCNNMRERNQHLTLKAILPMWQLILNFIGDSKNENPIMLTGRAMNQEEAIREAEASNNRSALYIIKGCAAFLAVFYGSWSTAAELLQEIKPFERMFQDHFFSIVIKLFEGLVAYEQFRRTEKKQFLVTGREVTKHMKQLGDAGSVTCRAFSKLLQAEDAATKGNMTATSKAYDKAIEKCKQHNLLPFEALACERAGTFMHRENMKLLTEKYLTRAMQVYKTWGARTKRSRLGLLMQGLPTASRYNMTFQPTCNGRTIPSDANAEAYGPQRVGRRGSRFSMSMFDVSMQTESFVLDEPALVDSPPPALIESSVSWGPAKHHVVRHTVVPAES